MRLLVRGSGSLLRLHRVEVHERYQLLQSPLELLELTSIIAGQQKRKFLKQSRKGITWVTVQYKWETMPQELIGSLPVLENVTPDHRLNRDRFHAQPRLLHVIRTTQRDEIAKKTVVRAEERSQLRLRERGIKQSELHRTPNPNIHRVYRA